MIYHYGEDKFYAALNDEPIIELFDLNEDSEELNNLSEQLPELANQYLQEIFSKLEKRGLYPE